MAYQKQNFKDGQVLTAAQMNHIEDGVVTAEEKADRAVELIEKLSGTILAATVE